MNVIFMVLIAIANAMLSIERPLFWAIPCDPVPTGWDTKGRAVWGSSHLAHAGSIAVRITGVVLFAIAIIAVLLLLLTGCGSSGAIAAATIPVIARKEVGLRCDHCGNLDATEVPDDYLGPLCSECRSAISTLDDEAWDKLDHSTSSLLCIERARALFYDRRNMAVLKGKAPLVVSGTAVRDTGIVLVEGTSEGLKVLKGPMFASEVLKGRRNRRLPLVLATEALLRDMPVLFDTNRTRHAYWNHLVFVLIQDKKGKIHRAKRRDVAITAACMETLSGFPSVHMDRGAFLSVPHKLFLKLASGNRDVVESCPEKELGGALHRCIAPTLARVRVEGDLKVHWMKTRNETVVLSKAAARRVYLKVPNAERGVNIVACKVVGPFIKGMVIVSNTLLKELGVEEGTNAAVGDCLKGGCTDLTVALKTAGVAEFPVAFERRNVRVTFRGDGHAILKDATHSMIKDLRDLVPLLSKSDPELVEALIPFLWKDTKAREALGRELTLIELTLKAFPGKEKEILSTIEMRRALAPCLLRRFRRPEFQVPGYSARTLSLDVVPDSEVWVSKDSGVKEGYYGMIGYPNPGIAVKVHVKASHDWGLFCAASARTLSAIGRDGDGENVSLIPIDECDFITLPLERIEAATATAHLVLGKERVETMPITSDNYWEGLKEHAVWQATNGSVGLGHTVMAATLWSLPEKVRMVPEVQLTLFLGLVQPMISAKKSPRPKVINTLDRLVAKAAKYVQELANRGIIPKQEGVFKEMNLFWEPVVRPSGWQEFGIMANDPAPNKPVETRVSVWLKQVYLNTGHLLRPWKELLGDVKEYNPGKGSILTYMEKGSVAALGLFVRLVKKETGNSVQCIVHAGRLTGFKTTSKRGAKLAERLEVYRSLIMGTTDKLGYTRGGYWNEGVRKGLDMERYLMSVLRKSYTLKDGTKMRLERPGILVLLAMAANPRNFRGAALLKVGSEPVGSIVASEVMKRVQW